MEHQRFIARAGSIFLLACGYYLVAASCVYSASFDRAEALYLQHSYSDSINECASLIERGNNLDYAYYLLGLNYLKLNNTDKAREKLSYLLDKFKTGKFIDAARLTYADSFFMDQDYAKAKDGYEELLKNRSSLGSILYYRLGQCALKTGNWQEAKNYFNTLKSSYPLSLEAIQSSGLIQAQVDDLFFTVQVGCFANINNAQKLVEKLKSKDFPVYIDEIGAPDGRLYRVRVGKLKSRQEADGLKDILDKAGYPTRVFP